MAIILADSSDSLGLTESQSDTFVLFYGQAIDNLIADGQILLLIPISVSDSLSSYDSSLFNNTFERTIIDNIQITPTALIVRNILADVMDSLNCSEDILANCIYQVMLNSLLSFKNELQGGDKEWSGYCVNKELKATSIYNNFKFNSYAFVNGKYFGGDGFNICEIGSFEDDDGEVINSLLTTGLFDAGTDLKKSVDNVYIAIKSEGEVFLRCIADGKEYVYKLIRENNGKFEVSRVKIGKGLRAINWEFELFNSDGSDFDIDSMVVYPLILSRHI